MACGYIGMWLYSQVVILAGGYIGRWLYWHVVMAGGYIVRMLYWQVVMAGGYIGEVAILARLLYWLVAILSYKKNLGDINEIIYFLFY